jgi:two-component system, chemotaxis family, chemotaxis protein CheY
MTNPNPSHSGRAAPNVLIVDDDADIRDAFQEVLEMEGYDAVACANGQEALKHLRQAAPRPALILLDLMMPEMNGAEFLVELKRSLPEAGKIPIVILSAVGERAQIPEGLPFIRKPIDLDTLLSTIKKHLA